MSNVAEYIKKLRKEQRLTQSELAERLNISFQAVSKWETGETLPDTGILLDLCSELDTTVDMLLNGGVVINKKRKLIKVESIVEGFKYFDKIKECFGEDSYFYKGLISGISNQMNFDFEETYRLNKEVLYTEVILNFLSNGYRINLDEAKIYIKNEKYLKIIENRLK